MPIQPIKIPQNVYIEDRIVGPLTLRQIIIVGIGAGFSYALWSSISKAYGYVGIPLTVLVWIPAVVAAAFAFLRVNDVSLFRILLLMVERMNKPSTRTFAPRRGITVNIRTFSTPSKDAMHAPSEHAKEEKIRELSSVLDTSFGKSDEPTIEDPQRGFPTRDGTPSATLGTGSDAENSGTTSDEPDSVRTLPRPVQRDRIRTSPGPSEHSSVDGVSDHPRVSIFRDIA